MTAISVVIPTYNRIETLRYVIPALLGQSVEPEAYEIIVADSNSSDGTAEYLAQVAREHPNVQYRAAPYTGRAMARNAGIEAARGAVVLFAHTGNGVERFSDSVDAFVAMARGVVKNTQRPVLVFPHPARVPERLTERGLLRKKYDLPADRYIIGSNGFLRFDRQFPAVLRRILPEVIHYNKEMTEWKALDAVRTREADWDSAVSGVHGGGGLGIHYACLPPRWREVRFGAAEGLRWREIVERFPAVARAWADPAYKERLLRDGTAAVAELGFTGNRLDALPPDTWLYGGLAEFEAYRYVPAGMRCVSRAQLPFEITSGRTAHRWLALRAGPFGVVVMHAAHDLADFVLLTQLLVGGAQRMIENKHPRRPALRLHQRFHLGVVDPPYLVLVVEIGHFRVVPDEAETVAVERKPVGGKPAIVDGDAARVLGAAAANIRIARLGRDGKNLLSVVHDVVDRCFDRFGDRFSFGDLDHDQLLRLVFCDAAPSLGGG